MESDWRIERLDASHERGEFRCGKPSLDEFLRALAGQYEKRRIGRTYVAVLAAGKRVYGYYTLAAGAIPLQSLPPKLAKKLPKHPVPVAHLGRLAVDQTAQGRGCGAILLADALKRCINLAAELGVFAVEVQALDEEAKGFYRKYGFVPLVDDELHMYLAMKTIQDSVKKAGS